MKKLSSVAIMLIISLAGFPQKARLNVYSSHVFNETFVYKQNGYTFYKGQINQGLQWGTGLECMVDKQVSVEVMYLHQSANMSTTYEARAMDPSKTRNYDLGINYILAGGNARFSCPNHKVEGFGGLFAGAAISEVKNNVDNGSYCSSTKFSWLAKLGSNIWVARRVGIKLQAQISSTIQSVGKNCYLGAMGLSLYSCMWQFSVGGGLTFDLGK